MEYCSERQRGEYVELRQDSCDDAVPESLKTRLDEMAEMKADTSKVTKAIMSVKLQRKSGSTYVTVKNWRDESASADATGYIKFQRRFTVFDRGTYRVKVDGKVYKGSSVVDTFSVVSAERVY